MNFDFVVNRIFCRASVDFVEVGSLLFPVCAIANGAMSDRLKGAAIKRAN